MPWPWEKKPSEETQIRKLKTPWSEEVTVVAQTPEKALEIFKDLTGKKKDDS